MKKTRGACMFQFRILTLLLGALLVQGSVLAQYSGGSGTGDDPWVIVTSADLSNLTTNPADWGASFVQSGPIDMSAEGSINPIGTFDEPFTGTYDGSGFCITNLLVLGAAQSQPGGDGLFGVVQETGAAVTIQRVTLVSPTVIGASPDTGGLVGRIESGTVQDCKVQGGYISGVEAVGGLAGTVMDAAAVLRCYSTACILGAEDVGGLIGLNTGVVEDCYCRQNTVAQWGPLSAGATNVNLGGLVGRNFTGRMASCYADCDKVLSQSGTPDTINAGGLVGTWVLDQVAILFGPVNYSCEATFGLPTTFNNAIGSPANTDLKAWSNLIAVSVPQYDLQLESTFENWDFDYVWTIVSGQSPELQ